MKFWSSNLIDVGIILSFTLIHSQKFGLVFVYSRENYSVKIGAFCYDCGLFQAWISAFLDHYIKHSDTFLLMALKQLYRQSSKQNFLIDMNLHTLFRDQICTSGETFRMCPQCDFGCESWYLSDTCIFARVSKVISELNIHTEGTRNVWRNNFQTWKKFLLWIPLQQNIYYDKAESNICLRYPGWNCLNFSKVFVGYQANFSWFYEILTEISMHQNFTDSI